jgi:SAM-dependent methyltransferase
LIATARMKSAFIYAHRFPRRILKSIFQFDEWHLMSAAERKYVAEIIAFLNSLPKSKRDSVVEIGCGLGDIIRNLRFKKKFGYDGEEKVIKAASLVSALSFDKTRFFPFVFPFSVLKGKWNVIVLVNWIHHIEPSVLKENIQTYFSENLLSGGCVVVDTVQASNYKYNHDISFLSADISCNLVKIGSYESQREVFAMFKL